MHARVAEPESQRRIGGRYRVEGLLAQGGMGEVLAVRDETGERLALKRLRADRADPMLVALFEREYSALASLRHPHIVRVFDYGLDDEGAFYTMELLEGGDLADAAPMPWREVCTCLRDLASILGLLHARKLVHRDLSPRNLWRTLDGRLKLLDFGALSPFGKPCEIVGTPPLVAPEMLEGRDLDGRADLYALGALGYWLLTGTHAFRAGGLGELPALWEHRPARPSRWVQLIDGADHDVPPELDELLLALLSHDARHRPRRTVDIVDSLNLLAGLDPEADEEVVRAYLDSSAFVGRQRELSAFSERLERAKAAQPTAVSIEGVEASGRSRLLAECATAARLSGVAVVEARGTGDARPYALATAIARGLLLAQPELARRTCEPHAEVVAGISQELGRLLRAAAPPEAREEPATRRAKRQLAVVEWIRALASEQPLAIFVDDLHDADEQSQALLAELAHSRRGPRLLVVASLSSALRHRRFSAVSSFRKVAAPWRLPPLERLEVLALLRSVFGDVAYLERLTARLHVLSEGRPGACLMLARHLVRSGHIHYQQGTWRLPREVPPALPQTVHAGAVAALDDLSADGRRLAGMLAVLSESPVARPVARTILGWSRVRLDEAVDELLSLTLIKEASGLELLPLGIRELLSGGVGGAERAQLHGQLAAALDPDAEDGIGWARVGLHTLYAGDLAEGKVCLLRAIRMLTKGERAHLAAAAPLLAKALQQQRAAGEPEYARAPTLMALCFAGSQSDGAFALEHGDETRRVLETMLCLPLARRLRPVLGGKLALVVGLGTASLQLKLRRSPIGLPEVLRWFVGVMGSLAGVAATLADAPSVRRYADALEPFAALGEDSAAGFMHAYCVALALGVEDRLTECVQESDRLMAKLQASPPADINARTRDLLHAGAHFGNAIRDLLALRADALRRADVIEVVGPLQAMQADFIRAIHHANHGDLKRARRYRTRVEAQAIRLGSGWRAEATAPVHDMLLAFWLHDAVALHRAHTEMERHVEQVPHLRAIAMEGHAGYLLLRGRFQEVKALLLNGPGRTEVPIGWSRRQAVLAAAHNALGEHEEARRCCQRAVAVRGEDMSYIFTTLGLLLELSLAEAYLGETASAKARLDSLLTEHADKGPLLLGNLHATRVRVAFAEGDFPAARRHIAATEQHFDAVGAPSLLRRIAQLRAELDRLEKPECAETHTEIHLDDGHLMTRLQVLMAQMTTQGAERTVLGLRIAASLSRAVAGFLLVQEGAEPVATTGDVEIPPRVYEWAISELAEAQDDEETVLCDEHALPEGGISLRCDDTLYCLTLLWHRDALGPIAALVLGFRETTVALPPDSMRRVLAQQLWERLCVPANDVRCVESAASEA